MGARVRKTEQEAGKPSPWRNTCPHGSRTDVLLSDIDQNMVNEWTDTLPGDQEAMRSNALKGSQGDTP